MEIQGRERAEGPYSEAFRGLHTDVEVVAGPSLGDFLTRLYSDSLTWVLEYQRCQIVVLIRASCLLILDSR